MENMVQTFSEEHNLPMKVSYTAQRGYHIQMSRAAFKAIKGRNFHASQLPKEFINPHQGKTTISFTTETIAQLDQQSQALVSEITLISNVIIQELICTLRSDIGSLYKLSDVITNLDLLAALADVSSMTNYTRPRFGPFMYVKGSRHPIMEKMDLPGEIVSNDLVATPIEANFQVSEILS